MIAAANPMFGDYDRSQTAAWNIGLPDSLLSWFDLVFIVLDEKNAKKDNVVSDWVITNHQYDNKGENLSVVWGGDDFIIQPILTEAEASEVEESIVWVNQTN